MTMRFLYRHLKTLTEHRFESRGEKLGNSSTEFDLAQMNPQHFNLRQASSHLLAHSSHTTKQTMYIYSTYLCMYRTMLIKTCREQTLKRLLKKLSERQLRGLHYR
jgi:hypothetical protein